MRRTKMRRRWKMEQTNEEGPFLGRGLFDPRIGS